MEENKKEFKCNQCDKSYALKRVLNMHVKDRNEGTKNVQNVMKNLLGSTI